MVGETPMSYMTDWRILKAKELLKNNNDSIEQIAERVGYTSEASFNRVFKKKVSQTPGVYRRAMSKKS